MENRVQYANKQDRHPHLQWTAIALLILMVLGNIASTVLRAIATSVPGIVQDYSFNMINVIVSQLVCMLLPVIIVCNIKKYDFLTVMRLRKGVNFLQVLMLIGISFGLIYVANGINQVFMGLLEGFTGYRPSGSGLNVQTVPQAIFTAFLYGILPAFCEEFFFRGLVLRSFERFSAFAAIVLSAVIFGIMHGNLQQLLFASVIGVVFAIVVRYTDSIVPAMIMHFTNNFFAAITSYISSIVSSSEAQVDPTFIETISSGVSLVTLGLPILAIIVPYILYTRKRNERKYGKKDPEEVKKGYAGMIQQGNVAVTPDGAVQLNPAGSKPVLAYIALGIYISSELFNILIDFLSGTGVLGV